MKTGNVLRLLFSIAFIVLAIVSYYWFDNLTNIRFTGSMGVANIPVYVFPEKQVDCLIANNKGYAKWQALRTLAINNKLPDPKTFFNKVPETKALAETKTGPNSGGFSLSFPRKNLPKDDNLVIVAHLRRKLWFRLVRVPEDTEKHEIDLGDPNIVYGKIPY